MPQQTIDLGVPGTFSASEIRWQNLDTLIIAGLSGSATRYIRSLRVFSVGFTALSFADNPSGSDLSGQDLTDLFETDGSITITVNGDSVTLLMGGDSVEQYTLNAPGNENLASDWFAGISAPINTATLTLRDYVPGVSTPLAGRLSVAPVIEADAPTIIAHVPLIARLSVTSVIEADAPVAFTPSAVPLAGRLSAVAAIEADAPVTVAAAVPLAARLATALTVSADAPVIVLVLAASDDTDLDVVAKALLVASAPGTIGNTIYADSDRGGSGSPLDGELGLGDGNTLISRFRRVSTTELLINDNDNPVALTLSTYFTAGGDGADLTLYFQTLADGEVSFAVSSQYLGAGGGFVRFTLPADAQVLFDGIGTGDRFIFKAARSIVAVSLAGRLSVAATVLADAPVTVEAVAVSLAGRLSVAATIAADAPAIVEAVPLAGRLSIDPVLSADAPTLLEAVSLAARLSVASVASADAPIVFVDVPLIGRLVAALAVSAYAPVAVGMQHPEYRAARDARSLFGRAQVFAIEAHHSGLVAPIRIVADNKEHTVGGFTYIPCAFSAIPPQSVDGEVRQAHLRIDNVGEKMMTWVNVSRGGRGASVRVMSLIAAITGESESTIDYEFEMDVGVAEVTNEQISITLTDEPTVGRPAITLRHDPLVSPGLFNG